MTLFRAGDPRPIHFMGIAGAGMSALAMVARHRGVAITGCDSDISGTAADDLIALGVPVWRGHDPHHVEGARAIVVTAAVPRDHPELDKARALGLPVVRRADALGDLVAGGKEGVVAVRSEEHTSELQSRLHLVCRLLLEKKKDVVASLRPRGPGGQLMTAASYRGRPHG